MAPRRVGLPALIAALLLCGPEAARAQSWTHAWTLCTPSEAFHSCHSVSLRTDAVMNGTVRQGTLISIAVHNLQGQGYTGDNTTTSALSQTTFVRPDPIGSYESYVPVVGTPSGGASGSPHWTAHWGLNRSFGAVGGYAYYPYGSPYEAIRGCSANPLYPTWGYSGETCAPDSWITFSFAIGANVDANQFTTVVIQALGERWDQGPSCFSDPGMYPEYPACDVRAESLTDNTVPEPVTIVLLGTGLFGLAGAGLRRKKDRSGAA